MGASLRVWKVLGMAGLAGVAATGVAVARAERRRRTYEPDDVRARLHERYQESLQAEAVPQTQPQTAAERATPGRLTKAWTRVRRIAARRRRPR